MIRVRKFAIVGKHFRSFSMQYYEKHASLVALRRKHKELQEDFDMLQNGYNDVCNQLVLLESYVDW